MRRGRELVLVAAGVAVLALWCWVFGLGGLMTALRHASPPYLLVYFFCALAVIFGFGVRWWWVTGMVGGRPPLLRLVAARMAGDAIGALVPSGKLAGDPVRVALVYRGGQSGTQASAGVAIDRMIEMANNTICAVGYATVFSLAHTGDQVERSVLVIVGTMLVLLISLATAVAMLRRGRRPLGFVYKIRLAQRWPRIGGTIQLVRQTEDHLIAFFRDHPGVFARGLALSLLIEGVQILEFNFLLRSFGITLEIATLFMVLLASGLARAVPTPASLGALETGEVLVLAAASGRADIGFVVGMVMRLHDTLWTAVGLVVLSAEGLSLRRAAAAAEGCAALPQVPRAANEA